MDIEPIIDGLYVSGIGMGMTSAVLIILALSVRSMALIDAYSKRRAAAKIASDEAEPEPTDDSGSVTANDSAENGASRAAAIAVAIALSQRTESTANTSHLASSGPDAGKSYDAWLTEGRARQRSNRGLARVGKAWK